MCLYVDHRSIRTKRNDTNHPQTPPTHTYHTQVPTLAVVENMAYFLCGQCQTRHRIFGGGGGDDGDSDASPALRRIQEVCGSGTPIVLPFATMKVTKWSA